MSDDSTSKRQAARDAFGSIIRRASSYQITNTVVNSEQLDAIVDLIIDAAKEEILSEIRALFTAQPPVCREDGLPTLEFWERFKSLGDRQREPSLGEQMVTGMTAFNDAVEAGEKPPTSTVIRDRGSCKSCGKFPVMLVGGRCSVCREANRIALEREAGPYDA